MKAGDKSWEDRPHRNNSYMSWGAASPASWGWVLFPACYQCLCPGTTVMGSK